jgi:hypothetical protein
MADNNQESSKLSRRDFARRTALAAATAAAMPGTLLATANEGKRGGKATLENQAEIDSKIQAIFHRYGDRLSDAQKADIRRLVREGQKPLEAMRAFPLDNADQPGNVLKLYPDPPGEDDVVADSQR